jgi:hypothetical protein
MAFAHTYNEHSALGIMKERRGDEMGGIIKEG